MTIFLMLVWFILWIIIGYFLFYFRYEDAKLIDELRKNFRKTKQDFEKFSQDIIIFQDENQLLREETKKLLVENEDLQKIVSQLNIYVYRLKIWSEKAKELAKILGIYNQDLENRVRDILWDRFEELDEWEDSDWDKRFF